jgi:excisionase family DNA binding protein
MAGRVFTVKQAAGHAGCHPETIRRAIRRRELLATKEPTKRGRGYVILPHDLNSWLEKRRVG